MMVCLMIEDIFENFVGYRMHNKLRRDPVKPSTRTSYHKLSLIGDQTIEEFTELAPEQPQKFTNVPPLTIPTKP